MQKITKKYKIENIYKRWVFQYPNTKEDIARQLKSVKSEEEIFKIIGNKTWTMNICAECKMDSSIIIKLGEEEDYDSLTSFICVDCLQNALKLAARGNH